jgi:tRNA threonylcarbamoyladenosine biosynthesis protein TsaE
VLFSSFVDTIISNSPEETQAFARRLAVTLGKGVVVALTGDLGAGKTHFTKGLVEAFGGDPREVTSPTFTLVHEYREGRVPVFHFDFYRLDDAAQLRHIGWDDYLLEDGVLVVEWAERFPEALPSDAVRVRFVIGEGNERKLEVER